MDIVYSLDAIRIQKTGFFYQREHKVIYSEFKKVSDAARNKKIWRQIVKGSHSRAKNLAKKQYEFYLRQMAWHKMEAVKFQCEARKAELLDQETLAGIITGPVTQNILEGVRIGAITRQDQGCTFSTLSYGEINCDIISRRLTKMSICHGIFINLR